MILDRHPERQGKHDVRKERAIGYWSAEIRPQDFVDQDWNERERALVADYLNMCGETVIRWRGSAQCRICDIRRNGSTCESDGTFIWPRGFGHYLSEHGVKPPQEFIAHVLASNYHE